MAEWAVAARDDAPPPKAWNRKRLLATGLALLVVGLLAGGLLLLAPSNPAPKSKFVAVFVTDLPGYERIRLDLAAVTVGLLEDPLRVEVAQVEISSLHGPQDALRVAAGEVPLDGGTDVSLVFSRAEVYQAERWVPLDMPMNRLTVKNAIAPGDYASNAALFDFNLEASLVAENGFVRFEPQVQTVYQHSTQTVKHEWDLLRDLPEFVEFRLPLQQLDEISDRVVEKMCERISCSTPAASSAGPTSGAQRTAPPAPSLPPLREQNRAPLPLGGPAPADGATRLGLAPTLTWTGGTDPEGRGVTYRVTVNDAEKCSGLAAPTCTVAGLVEGTTYVWRVYATDADEAETAGPAWRFTTNHNPAVVVVAPTDESDDNEFSLWLDWTADDADPEDGLSFRTYIGTTSPPTVLLCDWTEESRCRANELAQETTYYWRIIVKQGSMEIPGEVWSFGTRLEDANVPINPLGP